VDILDVIIVVFLIVFAVSGLRRGLTGVALALAGLLAGLFLGAVIAPPIARAITQDRTTQPLFAIGIFMGVALLIEGIGGAIGFRIRQRTEHTALLGKADSVVGAVLGLVAALAAAWYLGLMFSQSPWVTLDNQISNSSIERSLDRFMPRPPGFLATIGNLFRPGEFPNPFSTILNVPPAPVAIPLLVDTAGIRQAASVTSKVIASGCGGGEAGSSWPLAAGYFVTNAHVVAGSSTVEIDTPNGARHPARVVLFDPNTDLAVLYAPGLAPRPLVLVNADPARGTAGAVIGYPGGGGEQVVSAAVSGTESARGYNIYGDTLVTRDIEVLAARVIPGNSGGPIVNAGGQIIGVVFAASTTEPNAVGYALTIPQVFPDLQAGEHRTAAVSTRACAG
jgi:S1-C subfamily serine protease